MNHRNKKNHHTRLRCERLESRRLLAVDATIVDGDLLITGSAEGTVTVTALEDGSMEVKEGESVIATLTGFRDDIKIQLDGDGAVDDNVVLLLEGVNVDRVMIDLGGGNNNLQIDSGTIEGSLLFLGGDGNDQLQLGESVEVMHSVYAWMGNGDNTVQLDGTIDRSLFVRGGTGMDSVTLSESSEVAKRVDLNLGNGANSASIAGEIGESLQYNGGTGDDSVTIEESGVVLGNVQIQLGSGDNQVTHLGEIEGNLNVKSKNADDTLTVDANAIVGGRVTESFGVPQRRGRHPFHFFR